MSKFLLEDYGCFVLTVSASVVKIRTVSGAILLDVVFLQAIEI